MGGKRVVLIAVAAVAAIVGLLYLAARLGARSLEEAGRQYAEEAESQIDAGGAQQHLGKEGEGAESLLAEAGRTPEATVWAYYYYKDRGLSSKVRPLLAQDSLSMMPEGDIGAMTQRAQELREIVVDHVDATEAEATVYFRSWFSLGTKARGGRPYVFRLVKEDGQWKVSVPISLQLTMGLAKGKDAYGFYDGTAEWWK